MDSKILNYKFYVKTSFSSIFFNYSSKSIVFKIFTLKFIFLKFLSNPRFLFIHLTLYSTLNIIILCESIFY